MFKFKELDYLTDGEIDLKIEEKIQSNSKLKYVPTYKYRITLHQKDETIGRIDIRIGNNKNTYYGGNIGYEIYPSFQGHRYAMKACKIIKEVAIAHKMKSLYITCNPDNYPSKRTCELLGLTFIELVNLPEDNDMYQSGEKQKLIFEWNL